MTTDHSAPDPIVPPSVDQAQTRRSFSDKWTKNPSLAVKQTLDPTSTFQKWILERNGWMTTDALQIQLRKYKRILDAGCGNGRVTALLASLASHAEVIGIDQIDLAPAQRNVMPFPNAAFRKADLRKSLDALGRFDFIYCQEVLHHTGDAAASFANLASILAPDGEIAIYVYRRKAPAREFMDDFVRERISDLPYEEAMVVCRQITELGRRLAQSQQEIAFEDIPAIGIERGRYTPQRLLYNFFLKCYWNPDLSFEDNAVINYDWYHPSQCTRHTLEEVRGWFDDARLRITWENQDLYGVTIHGSR
jgi:SAM-dependent methyltransferase